MSIGLMLLSLPEVVTLKIPEYISESYLFKKRKKKEKFSEGPVECELGHNN